MADSTDWVEKADGKSVGTVVFLLIASPLIALTQGASEAVYNITGIFSAAADKLATASGQFITTFTTDPLQAMSGLIDWGAQSMTSGGWSMLGPLVIPVFGLIVLATIWEFLEFLDRRDSDIPLTGMDIPILGNDADGEED